MECCLEGIARQSPFYRRHCWFKMPSFTSANTNCPLSLSKSFEKCKQARLRKTRTSPGHTTSTWRQGSHCLEVSDLHAKLNIESIKREPSSASAMHRIICLWTIRNSFAARTGKIQAGDNANAALCSIYMLVTPNAMLIEQVQTLHHHNALIALPMQAVPPNIAPTPAKMMTGPYVPP